MRILKRIFQSFLDVATYARGGDYLAPMYREMHKQNKFKGVTWQLKFSDFNNAVPSLRAKTILDFGCGPLGGVAQKLGERVISYDPYVEEFSSEPWGKDFSVIHSSDVLEHMT